MYYLAIAGLMLLRRIEKVKEKKEKKGEYVSLNTLHATKHSPRMALEWVLLYNISNASHPT